MYFLTKTESDRYACSAINFKKMHKYICTKTNMCLHTEGCVTYIKEKLPQESIGNEQLGLRFRVYVKARGKVSKDLR